MLTNYSSLNFESLSVFMIVSCHLSPQAHTSAALLLTYIIESSVRHFIVTIARKKKKKISIHLILLKEFRKSTSRGLFALSG
jgi:hypothetical protein